MYEHFTSYSFHFFVIVQTWQILYHIIQTCFPANEQRPIRHQTTDCSAVRNVSRSCLQWAMPRFRDWWVILVKPFISNKIWSIFETMTRRGSFLIRKNPEYGGSLWFHFDQVEHCQIL